MFNRKKKLFMFKISLNKKSNGVFFFYFFLVTRVFLHSPYFILKYRN
jgi:hypothetical protein